MYLCYVRILNSSEAELMREVNKSQLEVVGMTKMKLNGCRVKRILASWPKWEWLILLKGKASWLFKLGKSQKGVTRFH